MTTSSVPELASYDWIVLNSSAGKDSQAMLDYVVSLCDEAGVARAKLVVVHADLGRMEWGGTKELAAEQTAHYGLRFEVVRAPGGDLLERVQLRRKKLLADGKPNTSAWPSPEQRSCTSDLKRGPVRTLLTRLVAETRRRRPMHRVRILNCMGMRAQESKARSKLMRFSRDTKATNGKRIVDTWLPIHNWKIEEVWARIKCSGVPSHRAYALGMPRLSCCFCIFAPKAALVLAGKHNTALLREYVEVEREVQSTFKLSLSLRDVLNEVEAGACETGPVEDWNM